MTTSRAHAIAALLTGMIVLVGTLGCAPASLSDDDAAMVSALTDGSLDLAAMHRGLSAGQPVKLGDNYLLFAEQADLIGPDELVLKRATLSQLGMETEDTAGRGSGVMDISFSKTADGTWLVALQCDHRVAFSDVQTVLLACRDVGITDVKIRPTVSESDPNWTSHTHMVESESSDGPRWWGFHAEEVGILYKCTGPDDCVGPPYDSSDTND